MTNCVKNDDAVHWQREDKKGKLIFSLVNHCIFVAKNHMRDIFPIIK